MARPPPIAEPCEALRPLLISINRLEGTLRRFDGAKRGAVHHVQRSTLGDSASPQAITIPTWISDPASRTWHDMTNEMKLRRCLFGFGLSAALLASCSGSSGSSGGRTLKDQAGHTCTIPPSGTRTISCDATPVPGSPCVRGASPCFAKDGIANPVFSGPPNSGVCAACCGPGDLVSNTDCSPVVCKTVDDCFADDHYCQSGLCY